MTHTVRLPKGWDDAEVGQLGEVITGSTPSTKQREFYGGSVPFVRPQELLGLPITKTETTLTEAGAQAGRVVSEDTILVGCIGTLGKTGITTTLSAFNQQINAIVPSGACMPKWLLYGIQSPEFKRQMIDNASATTVTIINKGRFSLLRLPLAPLPEQHRIVEAIESYLTRLDDAVASLERVQRNLERYRASVLKAAVEGRLVPTEADLARKEGRSYEPARELLKRILAERKTRWIEDAAEKTRAKAEASATKAGKSWTTEDDEKALAKARKTAEAKYKEPPAPDTTDLPALPEGWCWCALESVCVSITDGDHAAPPQVQQGIPFLVIGDVRDGSIAFDDTRHVPSTYYEALDSARCPQRGDVLYTVTGSFGIPVCVDTDRDFCVQRHIGILKPSLEVNPRFLSRVLASDFIYKQAVATATGTAQKTVGLKRLRRFVVPLPPGEEQVRMLKAIEVADSVANHAHNVAQKGRSKVEKLRQSILNWAFEGKLVDQDPNDEPASVLLEQALTECKTGRAESRQ